MFTVTQSVENTAATPRSALPPTAFSPATASRQDLKNFFILHEGVVAMADGQLTEIDYDDMPDFEVRRARRRARAEVIEVTDQRLDRLHRPILDDHADPGTGQPFKSRRQILTAPRYLPDRGGAADADVAPGPERAVTTQLFAGAKEWETIRDYQKRGRRSSFIDTIDWGWFFFLTKPIFWLLHWLNVLIGNMGWSIIALTLIIKAHALPAGLQILRLDGEDEGTAAGDGEAEGSARATTARRCSRA